MRAISKNTRKATAITLAAALVIAVYLNWQYTRTGVTLEEDAVNVSAVSQETIPVTDELMTEAEAVSSANKNYGEAQLVSVANNSGSKFFEEARLKRTKAHDEAMDSIQKALKSASLSTEEKKEYTSQLCATCAAVKASPEVITVRSARPDCRKQRQSANPLALTSVSISFSALRSARFPVSCDIVLSKSSVTAQNITVVEVK